MADRKPLARRLQPVALALTATLLAFTGGWLWIRHGGAVLLAAMADFAMTCF